MPSIHAIVVRDHAEEVATILAARGESRPAEVVETGEGSLHVAAAARVPLDVLLVDVDAGPDLGPAIRNYRAKRSEARTILLAIGRSPGDPEVANVAREGFVVDIVADVADLAYALDHPAKFAEAARWLAPREDAEPESGGKPIVRERIVERRVPMSAKPTVIAVAGLTHGVGTTTLAAALAGYLARHYPVALLSSTQDRHLGRLTGHSEAGGQWVPQLYVFPTTMDVTATVNAIRRDRLANYIVIDHGVFRPNDPLLLEADLPVILLPGAPWRLPSSWTGWEAAGGPKHAAFVLTHRAARKPILDWALDALGPEHAQSIQNLHLPADPRAAYRGHDGGLARELGEILAPVYGGPHRQSLIRRLALAREQFHLRLEVRRRAKAQRRAERETARAQREATVSAAAPEPRQPHTGWLRRAGVALWGGIREAGGLVAVLVGAAVDVIATLLRTLPDIVLVGLIGVVAAIIVAVAVNPAAGLPPSLGHAWASVREALLHLAAKYPRVFG